MNCSILHLTWRFPIHPSNPSTYSLLCIFTTIFLQNQIIPFSVLKLHFWQNGLRLPHVHMAPNFPLVNSIGRRRYVYLFRGFLRGLMVLCLISIQPTQIDNEQSFANFLAVNPQNWQSLSNGPMEQRHVCLIKQDCNYDYMKEQNLFSGWSVSRRIRVDIQVPELIKVTSQFIYLDCFKSMKNYSFAGYVWVNIHCFMPHKQAAIFDQILKNANAILNMNYFENFLNLF